MPKMVLMTVKSLIALSIVSQPMIELHLGRSLSISHQIRTCVWVEERLRERRISPSKAPLPPLLEARVAA